MFASLPRPTLFAHRGSSKHAPENTLAAFQLAVTQGADAIELDVKLSADQQVVVIHDQTVDRTTNGTGRVARLPLSELRQLEAGSFFSHQYSGERIPTLEEVFESVGKKIFLNIELTNYLALFDSLPEKTAGLVRRHQMEGQVMFSSFSPVALVKIHRLLPNCPTGLITLRGMPGALLRSALGQRIPQQALHPERRDVTQALVERVHRSGRKVNAWVANEPAEIRRLVDCQVDGIITDDPLLARRVLNGEMS